MNTNARSLCPKIDSLLDCIEEMEATVAVVTETWLSDGQHLEDDKQDLLLGAGVSMICRNRNRNERTGLTHGGVAVMFREEACSFKEIKFDNHDNYEVLAVAGSIQGQKRKVLILACYIPPNYTSDRATGCLEYIYGLVIELKRRYKDPYLIVTGDFNQWNIGRALEDFIDVKESVAGPTRGSRTIDRTFTNFTNIKEAGVLAPLQTDGRDGHIRRSDHSVCFLTATLERRDSYKWLSYSYRYNSKEAAAKFGEWLVAKDWTRVLAAETSVDKAAIYQEEIQLAIDSIFPLRTIRRRNIDPPWINSAVKRLIRRRKAIFREAMGKRTEQWKKMKKKIEKLIEKRCRVYQESQRQALLADDGICNFFKNTKNYMSKQRPTPFDVMDLFPGKSEAAVAEELVQHFNSISSEFSPLRGEQVPKTHNRSLPILQRYEVATRIKKFRKPKSVVAGDIFPDIVTKFADILAIPLTSIYNKITQTGIWPEQWKRESVTIIPKTRTPTEVGQLRNISCTLLVSKIYESYVLQWALEEVKLKDNQFGGSKGCSTSHLLISVWQNILSDLEDCRAATVLTAIDYAKAFNRMSFQHCLKAFADHGASNQIIGLIATFLTDRSMSVRVGSSWSQPRSVNGGVPQGSILGVLLFNMTTDRLEDEQAIPPARNHSPPASPPSSSLSDSSESSSEEGREHPDHMSTPVRQQPHADFEPGITPFRTTGGSRFVFLASARNTFDRTVLRDRTLPDEPNPVTSAVWRDRPPDKHKYVDDGIIDTRIDMENVLAVPDPDGGLPTKDKHAIAAQNMFRRVVYNAEGIGMRVNTSKTSQICISDAQSFKAAAHIVSIEGERIGTTDTMKVLGFTFGSRPNCSEHVERIRRSIRGRYWLLIHLQQHGFNTDELLRVYTTVIRPVAEYCAPVFHSMLTDREDEQLERLQSTALRYIYGFGISYAKMRDLAGGLETLRSRRIALCDKFANKCVTSERFSKWFKPHVRRRASSRSQTQYEEKFARCERLRNSPLFYMRRRLNGKPGKTYGKRNQQYRE